MALHLGKKRLLKGLSIAKVLVNVGGNAAFQSEGISESLSAYSTSSGAWSHAQDPRKKRFWTESEMPDQDGKTFVITGGSSGMGLATADKIAKNGGHVIMASHNLEKSQHAARMIQVRGARGTAEAMHLNLASFRSVVNFAEAFKKRGLPLHVLIENAGTFLTPYKKTEEGFELTVGVNYFGHFLLTHLLIEKLMDTAQRDGEARLVAMSSLFELLGNVNFNDLEGRRATDSGPFEYANSKLMIIMSKREINKRLEGSGVELFLAQPGLVQTELAGPKLDKRKFVSNVLDTAANIFGQSAEKGSLCLQRPATDPSLRGFGGAYFSPPWLGPLAIQVDIAGMREPGNSLARDQGAWFQLYQQSLAITNSKLRESNLKEVQSISYQHNPGL